MPEQAPAPNERTQALLPMYVDLHRLRDAYPRLLTAEQAADTADLTCAIQAIGEVLHRASRAQSDTPFPT